MAITRQKRKSKHEMEPPTDVVGWLFLLPLNKATRAHETFLSGFPVCAGTRRVQQSGWKCVGLHFMYERNVC